MAYAKRNAPFDYDAVDAQTQEMLRGAAEVFERRPDGPVEAIQAGRTLLEVKEKLPHGHFLRWYQTESTWGFNTAARLMHVAKAFGSVEILQIAKFKMSALYILANPKLPKTAQATAISEVAKGRPIGVSRAKEIANAILEGKEPRIVVSKEEQVALVPLPPLVEDWRKRFDSLHLHVIEDEDGSTLIHGVAIERASGRRVAATRENAELVMMAITGREPQKRCNRCREMKGIGEFSSNVARRDGRAESCKICERKRMARIAKERRESRAPRKSPAEQEGSANHV
jgi:Protein of unknown function (DUF3102)